MKARSETSGQIVKSMSEAGCPPKPPGNEHRRSQQAVVLTVALCFCARGAHAQMTPPATVTTLALSAAALPSGQPVTLNATVEPTEGTWSAAGPDCPRGVVTVTDGNTVVATTQATVNGKITLKLHLGLGSHTLIAKFAGTRLYAPSSSGPQPFTVGGTVPTTTTISSVGSTGSYTLTGTVTNSGPSVPTGLVTFTDTTDVNLTLGSATLGSSIATPNFSATGASNQHCGRYGNLAGCYQVGGPSSGGAVADLNGDGVPDLAVATTKYDPTTGNELPGGTLTILLGNGDGTFQTKIYDVDEATASIAVSDFNGDGIPDLAVSNYNNTANGPGTIGIMLV